MAGKRTTIGAAVAAALVFFAVAARPSLAADVYEVSGPAAQFYGYASPVLAVDPTGTLTLLNVDISLHDIVAEQDMGSDDRPWCDAFEPGSCPLFWSPLVGLGERSEVQGLELLEPGRTYPFVCSIHPVMRGTLVALP